MRKLFLTLIAAFLFVGAAYSQWTTLGPGVQPRVRMAIAELQIMSQLPLIKGTWYFVDPEDGASTNSGKSIATAVASIETAYGFCTTGDGDGIAIISSGTSSAHTTSYLSDELTWSKNGITVYGVCAPTFYNQRARIADLSGVDSLAYLISVTGANNSFMNLSFHNSPDDSLKGDDKAQHAALKVTGVRNAFINVDIKCTPDDASASKTDLWLSGADETNFVNCNFGNASYDAGDNAACHIYADGTTGNGQILFDHCTTIAQVSTGTAFGCVESGTATSLNGSWIFRDCIFSVWQANTGLTAMASWFIGTKPNTGNYVIGPTCMVAGYAKWDATAGNDRVIVPLGVTDGDTDPNIGGTP